MDRKLLHSQEYLKLLYQANTNGEPVAVSFFLNHFPLAVAEIKALDKATIAEFKKGLITTDSAHGFVTEKVMFGSIPGYRVTYPQSFRLQKNSVLK